MKYIILALCALLGTSVLMDGPKATTVIYPTPQGTVSSYWHSMIEGRYDQALNCFLEFGGTTENLLQLPEMVELRCKDFEVSRFSRGQVDLTYNVEFRITMSDSLRSFRTGDRLAWTHGGWKIAAPILQ